MKVELSMKESHKPKAKNVTFEVLSLLPLPHHTLPQVWVAWDPANYLPPYLVMKSLTRVEIMKSGEVIRTALECAQSRRSPCPYEFWNNPTCSLQATVALHDSVFSSSFFLSVDCAPCCLLHLFTPCSLCALPLFLSNRLGARRRASGTQEQESLDGRRAQEWYLHFSLMAGV